ncbi:bleomycin resistance protein [Novosphingobium piscinae]|uniref:Bleomycin resistance protein n=1 Tax=Novosphingobium piscinae TaxID=1507448 RepID=A0A7X1FXN9_9SPHN|nr:bleomycin resistance protein [Novosphingobium piscinae]MBC2668806.1 bleomycin resistance protein [Novosphingobium piscinae]
MTDHATPNLPSRDFAATLAFYARLGFSESYRDPGWMILERGGLVLEFFPYPGLDPAQSAFSCCLRLDDVAAFHALILASGVPEARTGWPRTHAPRREPWGGLVGALIDPDGSLLRLVQEEA